MKKYKYLLLDEKACIKMLYEYDVCTSYFIYVKGVTDKFMLCDIRSLAVNHEYEKMYIEPFSPAFHHFLYSELKINTIYDNGTKLPLHIVYRKQVDVKENKVKQLFGIS